MFPNLMALLSISGLSKGHEDPEDLIRGVSVKNEKGRVGHENVVYS